MNQSYRRCASSSRRSMPRSIRWLTSPILWIALSLALFASRASLACTPTLTVGSPETNGNFVVSAHVEGTCGMSWVSIYVNDAEFVTAHCDIPFSEASGPSCTVRGTLNMSCLKAGPNSITAYGACQVGPTSDCQPMTQGSASSSVTGSTVTGALAYTGPDVLGHGTVTITYDVGQYRSGVRIWFFDNGMQQRFDTLPGQAGTDTFDYNFTCNPVTQHQLLARIAPWCDDPSLIKEDTKNATVTEQPSINATYDPIHSTVSITDAFPNTDTDAFSLRAIYYNINGGPWSQLGYPDCTRNESNTCNAPFIDLSCMSGVVNWLARSCQGTPGVHDAQYAMQIPTFNAPTVHHSPVVKNADGTNHIEISYTFPAPPGTITLNYLPTEGVAGHSTPYPGLPSQGVLILDLPTPPENQTVEIVATQTDCHYATDSFGMDCGCTPGPTPPTQAGGPVRMWDGQMTYTEHDPLPDDFGGVFSRTYDTASLDDGPFGSRWFSIFNAGVIYVNNPPVTDLIVYMENGTHVVFQQLTGGAWQQSWPSGRGARGTLSGSEGSGYAYRAAGSSIVRFYGGSGNHRLTSLRDVRSGRQLAITYDNSGAPSGLIDSFGAWSATITTDATHHITQIAIDGHSDLVRNYAYDGNGNLTTVTLAGSSAPWRSYVYVPIGGSWFLGSILDALGNTIEEHTYDGSGRAISSYDSSGDITNIQYNTNPSTTVVTRADGSTTTFEQSVADRDVTTHVTGGCGSCGGHDLTAAYDAVGHPWRVQDGRGYITELLYDTSPYGVQNLLSETRALRPSTCDPATDSSHCLMSSGSLAAATLTPTAASRTTSYVYGDPNWPDRPTVIQSPSLVSGQTMVESFTYDPSTGTALSHSMTGSGDLSGDQETHTTTTVLYDGAAAAAFDPGGTFQSSWLTLAQPAGMVKSVRGPRTDVDDTMLYVYYPIGSGAPGTAKGRLAAVKNALGHITHFDEYDVFGHATKITDPNGVVTTRAYDALGRLTTSTVKAVTGCDTTADPLCATDLTTTNLYANTSGPLSYSLGANRSATAYTYDSRGRVATVGRGSADCSGCPQPNVTTTEQIAYTYDAATQKKATESYQELVNSTWTERRRESYTYDSNGRLARITHADATSIVYGYDGADDLTSVQDERHTTANTIYAFDPAKRLSTVTQTLGTGSVVTSYGYDIRDDLTAVTDPNGNSTSYVFDDFGRMLRQTSPVTGVTTYGYDPSGNLLSTTDANSATTTRAYDALGRVLSAASSGGAGAAESVSWTYDGASPFAAGRLASMTDPAGSTTYAYDRRGLLLSEIRTDGQTFTTSYQYDAEGNRTVMTYPSGLTAQYGFDFSNHMTSVSAAGVAVVSSASYLPFGPMTRMVFNNGTTRSVSYDNRYRVTENKLTNSSGAALADFTYAEDAAGNITQLHDALNATYNRDFAYDDLNRLTTANSGASLWGHGSYTYDAMGNMLTLDLGEYVEVNPVHVTRCKFCLRPTANDVPATGSRHERYAYQGTTPLLDHVTTVQVTEPTPTGVDKPMTYDAAGNENHFYVDRTYTARNLMTGVTDAGEGTPHSITYTYDGRGIRVKRTETPTLTGSATRRFFYSPELRLLTMTNDDQPNVWGSGWLTRNSVADSRYDIIWFGGIPVGQINGGTSVRYTFADHLGTPIVQTDTNASITWQAEYEPYGDLWTLRTGTSRFDQPLRFPGQEVSMTWEGHEENYNIFRWYGAGLGRYTQADPIGLEGGVHLFSYTRSNPISRADRIGLVDVRDEINEDYYASADDWLTACQGRNAGGECADIGAHVDCECAGEGHCWHARATLVRTGYMRLFVGNYRDLPAYAQPADHAINNFIRARNHAYDYHIAPATNAALRILRDLEAEVFTDPDVCNDWCSAKSNEALQAFANVLRTTQQRERRTRR